MRSFPEHEKDIIRRLAVWQQGRPSQIELFFIQHFFTRASGQALIIQAHRNYAVLYHTADINDETKRQIAERQFFELLSLFTYLKNQGYIAIYRDGPTKAHSLFFLHESFSKPKIEGTTIVLNEAGDHSKHPEAILDKNGAIRFKGMIIDGDTYALVLNTMTGTLVVSHALKELVHSWGEQEEAFTQNKSSEIKSPEIKSSAINSPKIRDPKIKTPILNTSVTTTPSIKAPTLNRWLLICIPIFILCALSLGMSYRNYSAVQQISNEAIELRRQQHTLSEQMASRTEASVPIAKVDVAKSANRKPSSGKLNTVDPNSKESSFEVPNVKELSIGRLSAQERKPEAPKVLYGIDVSNWNGDISHALEQAQDLSFGISKATEGLTFIDAQFTRNRALFLQKGLIHGAYHFYREGDDALAQAEFFLETIGRLSANEMAPVVDVEQQSIRATQTVTPEQLQENLLRFLIALEEKTERIPIIYTNYAFAEQYLQNRALARYPLWLAEYSSDTPKIPSTWKEAGYFIWQRQSDYQVGDAQFDFDVFHGEISDLIR